MASIGVAMATRADKVRMAATRKGVEALDNCWDNAVSHAQDGDNSEWRLRATTSVRAASSKRKENLPRRMQERSSAYRAMNRLVYYDETDNAKIKFDVRVH